MSIYDPIPQEILKLNKLKDLTIYLKKYNTEFDNSNNQRIDCIGPKTSGEENKLNDCNIISIDAEIQAQKSALKGISKILTLKSLKLSGNYLCAIPTEVFNIKSLESLEISINQLTIIPVEIKNLINLKTLNVSDNKITSLSSEIGSMHNLKILNISKNEWKNYNLNNFHFPPNIEWLNISQNKI